jgi:hypothetical protein
MGESGPKFKSLPMNLQHLDEADQGLARNTCGLKSVIGMSFSATEARNTKFA